MLIKKPEIPSSEITPEAAYLSRRQFFGASAAALAGAAVPALAACDTNEGAAKSAALDTMDAGPQRDELTPLDDVTSYNNFYEYGTDKEDPADRKSTRLNSSHLVISYAVFC